jgi:hypothetical protein
MNILKEVKELLNENNPFEKRAKVRSDLEHYGWERDPALSTQDDYRHKKFPKDHIQIRTKDIMHSGPGFTKYVMPVEGFTKYISDYHKGK